jgi:hypothetical protein
MKTAVILLSLLLPSLSVAQQPTTNPFNRHIALGAYVLIEPMDGFEDYLMAA